MEHSGLSPHKERHDPSKIAEINERDCYPKPSWMLNSKVSDNVWILSKTGLELDYNENHDYGAKLSFSKAISSTELLTDKANQPLLKDIRDSLLYLDLKGNITRPERIANILNTVCYLILHANEIQNKNNQKPIRSLAEISFEHLKDYLLSFEVERTVFDESLEFILSRWKSKPEINWILLKKSDSLTTRKFLTLKNKLSKYLDEHHEDFNHPSGYKRHYANACTHAFDLDFDLAPKFKTISNELSKLQALFIARPAQKYKFKHSSMDLFDNGNTLFDRMIEPNKTPLIPAQTTLHTISASLQFCRTYGESIREYFSDLSKAEKELINAQGSTASLESINEFKRIAYENTPIPSTLKDLNITSWGYEFYHDVTEIDFNNGITFETAAKLYTASIWILICSFTSARAKSLLTLRRDCFKQSPIDGLFDLVLRIPKSSERWELEEAQRPIPDLIYDYGLEFAAFINVLEERRNLVTYDDDSFLFGQCLRTRSISASPVSKIEVTIHKKPLSDDHMNACLDLFMDWINSPLTDGKRWYPRTHQFRRFFAVLYFNFSHEEGLDELSWFMGHSNLNETFHYAELAPTDEWIEEAEITIANIGASLHKKVNADESICSIVEQARKASKISTIIEPLVKKLIAEHKEKTNQSVRFCKIDGEDVFFYFSDKEEN
ncbi:hypothetical protein [Motiliproteus sp.]|uniref:hypothetical protein n=1 Tax=Motiliproteus sp. TaxID=1898955 RepID=UPI003BA962DB